MRLQHLAIVFDHLLDIHGIVSAVARPVEIDTTRIFMLAGHPFQPWATVQNLTSLRACPDFSIKDVAGNVRPGSFPPFNLLRGSRQTASPAVINATFAALIALSQNIDSSAAKLPPALRLLAIVAQSPGRLLRPVCNSYKTGSQSSSSRYSTCSPAIGQWNASRYAVS